MQYLLLPAGNPSLNLSAQDVTVFEGPEVELHTEVDNQTGIIPAKRQKLDHLSPFEKLSRRLVFTLMYKLGGWSNSDKPPLAAISRSYLKRESNKLLNFPHRKLKNRVAAQVARDKKKARLEELENIVRNLQREVS